jgi:hypothetical protein
MTENTQVIWVRSEAKYFCKRGWTALSQNRANQSAGKAGTDCGHLKSKSKTEKT